mgnify:CR=1 FL=1
MRARIEMELDDTPGQLVKVLDPISKYGANIQNVVHKREELTPLGKVPVTVILEVTEKERLDKILEEVKKVGARITRVGEQEKAVKAVMLLVGKIIETDIRDSVERLNKIDGAKISDLTLAFGDSEGKSSARVIIWATTQDSLQKAVSKLKEVAKEKDLLIIEPLEGFE